MFNNENLLDYPQLDPNDFTPYKPEWEKYVGTYCPLFNWKLSLEARIGYILGTYGVGKYKVYEKDGYLRINGRHLDEYLPGVFFTKEGDCLDFSSGPLPLWKGVKIKKR